MAAENETEQKQGKWVESAFTRVYRHRGVDIVRLSASPQEEDTMPCNRAEVWADRKMVCDIRAEVWAGTWAMVGDDRLLASPELGWLDIGALREALF